MRLDDTDRCAGTRQPLRNAVLGLCMGCARYTLGPATMTSLAYIDKRPPLSGAWACKERRSMGAAHDEHDGTPASAGPSHEVGGAPGTLCGASAVGVTDGE